MFHPPLRSLAFGADHAGFALKQHLREFCDEKGHAIHDVGMLTSHPADYPDVGEALGLAILQGTAERGILICGSGVGASIAANKLPGVRAGLCHDLYSAAQGVEHDQMNLLVLGARIIAADFAERLLTAFLDATFSGEERHIRRLDKIRDLELRYQRHSSDA